MGARKIDKKIDRVDRKIDRIAELARIIHNTAKETKALDLVVLDLRRHATFADYLVICSGASTRQVQAIYQRVEKGVLEKLKRFPRGVEGVKNAAWILIDYGDVVCHIFTEESRLFYRLENLWHDAKRVFFRKKRTPKS